MLEDFLKAPSNTHFREAILMHRLFFDMKLAAAQRGFYLNTYFDDVDHDGFDVIFDDKDYLKKTQVKSVINSAATAAWDIHKSMLRPALGNIGKLGFEYSPEGEGTEGGVILIQFTPTQDNLDIEYFYLDVFILLAHRLGLIPVSHKKKIGAVEKCISNARTGSGRDLVSVPRAAFVRAKNPDALLALLGLHSSSSYAWKHYVFLIASNELGYAEEAMPIPSGMTIGSLKELAKESIAELCA